MQVQDIGISQIKPYKNNAKKHTATQIANVAESIRQFGWAQPIVVDGNYTIIIGHCRYSAAAKLGLATVPVVVAADLTAEQVRKLRNLDNKLNESEWELDLLKDDILGLDFDGFDISWGIEEEGQDYEEKMQEFRARMEAGELSEDSEEYQEFLQKFEPKKTTDDCYTPDIVYEAVADYVAEYYGVNKCDYIRPFYPNGDYQKEKYKDGAVVVDNPPFSIISKICKWYNEHNIKYFLFAPALTLFCIRVAQKLPCNVSVTYENGARVSTSFVTNMDEYEIRTDPVLYKTVENANKENEKRLKAELPKYSYPNELITATKCGWLAKYGQVLKLRACDCVWVSELDAQKKTKQSIFGGGYLISEKAAAEKAAAEKAAAEKAAAQVFELSEREKNIIKSIG